MQTVAVANRTSSLEEIQSSGVTELPPLPAAVSRLLIVIADPTHRAEDLAKVLRFDPSLSSSLLRLANSARFRPSSGPVLDLAQAAVIVGEENLVRLVLVKAAGVLRPGELPVYGYGEEGFWRRSVRTAVASGALAPTTGVSKGLAWVCGLLADVGKLVLGRQLVAMADRVASHMNAHPQQGFDATETALVGTCHAHLGAEIAVKWDLPEPIVAAIRHHHRPAEAPVEHQPLAYTVHVGDALAAMAAPNPGIDGMRYPLDPRWNERVPADERHFEQLLMRVERGVLEAQRMVRT